MDQSQQPRGKFTLNINFRRNGNAKAPPITGVVSTPEAPDQTFSFAAFEKIDKNGEPYWIGPVDTARSVRQALNGPAERGSHFVAIRENAFKVFKEMHDGSPNPAYAALSAAQQASEDKKPAYWGSWTRAVDDPQLRLNAWEREPNRYGPWASGNTQYPMTKEQAEALKAGRPDAATLEVAEPQAGPVERSAKGRDRGRG